MATQAEVDQLVQETQQIHDNLATAKGNIEERFAVLEKAIGEGKTGSDVDLGPLKAAIADLGAPTQELEDLEPVAAAPAAGASTAAPQNADGTAAEHTTDPAQAQAQAAASAAGDATPEQEAAAREQV